MPNDRHPHGPVPREPRARVQRALVTLGAVLCLSPLWAAPLHAQECDPAQPVLFSFDGSTPLVAMSAQDLVRRGASKLYVGRGEVQFDDDAERLALTVRAKVSKLRITYVVSGVRNGTQLRATIVTQECRSSVSKIKLRLRTPTLSGSITDPTLVGFAGVVKQGVVIVDDQSIGGLVLGPDDTFTLPSTAPLTQRLVAGRRVIATATPATPEGLLVEITDVVDDGTTTTYSTQPVPLGEAFDSLDIAFVREGKLKWEETVVEGIEKAPEAFLGLFTGANAGKMLVRLGPDAV